MIEIQNVALVSIVGFRISLVKETPLLVADTDDIGDLVGIHQVVAHLADEEGDLLIFLRRLVPLGMGLLDDADQDAQVGEPVLGRFEIDNGPGKQLGVASDLPIYDFGVVLHLLDGPRTGAVVDGVGVEAKRLLRRDGRAGGRIALP